MLEILDTAGQGEERQDCARFGLALTLFVVVFCFLQRSIPLYEISGFGTSSHLSIILLLANTTDFTEREKDSS